MKKLVLFEDGTQVLLENLTIERSSPVVEEIDLDALPEDERDELMKNRRKVTIERDEEGKVAAVKLGKKDLGLPRNG